MFGGMQLYKSEVFHLKQQKEKQKINELLLCPCFASSGEERHIGWSKRDHYVLRPCRLLGCWSPGERVCEIWQ